VSAARVAAGPIGRAGLAHGHHDFPEFKVWRKSLYDEGEVGPVLAWTTAAA